MIDACGEPDDASSIIPTKNIIQIILKLVMSSQSIPAEALNAYDDQSFMREDNSSREHEYDSTGDPTFLPQNTEDSISNHSIWKGAILRPTSCPKSRYTSSNTLCLFP